VNAYATLESAVLLLHLFWIAWILFGWLLTRGRPPLTIRGIRGSVDPDSQLVS